MNILFLTLMYHPGAVEETARLSRSGLQNQINSYQHAFADGLKQNLAPGEALSILNALPVGVFPVHYRRLFLRNRRFGVNFEEIGSLNLPLIKQRQRSRKACRAILEWTKKSPENRCLLVYSLYLPYMQAVEMAKKKCPGLRATVIVTDLPNELGIASGRRGLLKRAEYAMGDRRVALCRAFDGFVLLTRHMAEALPVQGKKQLVMEGLILPEAPMAAEQMEQAEERAEEKTMAGTAEASALPAVLYTGTLNRELGIGELLKAFEGMGNCQLWLCGKGDMEEEARRAAEACPNIRYFGFVSQREALSLQKKADILINPRSPQGVYTRYSFPSKTLEYMRSGKAVLCYPLEGIPAEYDEHLVYITGEGARGIQEAVASLLKQPREQREQLGGEARRFVLENKNARAQGRKLLAFLRQP